jgi:hypothetical protein
VDINRISRDFDGGQLTPRALRFGVVAVGAGTYLELYFQVINTIVDCGGLRHPMLAHAAVSFWPPIKQGVMVGPGPKA